MITKKLGAQRSLRAKDTEAARLSVAELLAEREVGRAREALATAAAQLVGVRRLRLRRAAELRGVPPLPRSDPR